VKAKLRFVSIVIACIVSFSGAQAADIVVLGPSQYERTKGTPNVHEDAFPGMIGEARLAVENGDPSGKNRVSSAEVWINGELVVRPEQLNQNIASLQVPVVLVESNTISIAIKSKPGSYLTISIVQDIPIELEAGRPGLALESADRLLVALPIENKGVGTAVDVQVTSASLVSAVLQTPLFPAPLGDIAGDDGSIFEASFACDALISGEPYLLTVAGTYEVGGLTLDFVLERELLIPGRSPGSAPLQFVNVPGTFVTGAPFPPGEPGPVDIPEGYNEEELPPIPTGMLRGDLMPDNDFTGFTPPTPAATLSESSPMSARGVLKSSSDPVLFFHSSEYTISNGTWLDPSGATCDDVVMGSYNGPVAFSADGGANYWHQDPRSVFPNKDADGNLIDGGFCCDQVIMYVPKIDRFIWLMQFRRALLPGDDPKEPSGPNRYRIAAASPADVIASNGTAWTYWDLTSGLFGFGNDWMDYPDLAVGDDFLYFSADLLSETIGGLFVGRIPLSDIESGGVISIGFTNPQDGAMAWASHLVQNVRDTAYWAGHNPDNQLRLFSLPEDEDYYYWVDIPIDSWPNTGDYASITPSGENWLKKSMGASIIGGTRLATTHFLPGDVAVESDVVWLAWTAARGGGFPHPQIQVVKIDTFDNSVVSQQQLWNADVAIAFPAMAVNTQGEVGMALAFGGGASYSNFAVGIFGEPTFFYPALADASVGRFGDYFAVRRHPPVEGLYSAFGMRYTLADPELSDLCRICSLDASTPCTKDEDCLPSKGVCSPNCRTNLHYVLFGRESAVEPPEPPS
jgi:hypothetical protein